MVTARVARVEIDHEALTRWLGDDIASAVTKASGRVRDMSRAVITAEGRVDFGHMRNAVESETVRVEGYQVVGRVTSWARHSEWQHDGTANDGTGYIYPRRAKVLAWKPKRGTVVYGRLTRDGYLIATRVRGVKGIRFLDRALQRLTVGDFL
jgi:hypothetical protein